MISLTPSDLTTAKAAPLVDALRTAALADGQSDPMPEIIDAVVARIRAEISAGGKTALDADPATVPPSLKSLALRMVLREGQSRLNAAGALPLSDDEREEWRQDVRYLERIAKGEVSIDATATPEGTPSLQHSGGVSLASSRPRLATRDSLGAL